MTLSNFRVAPDFIEQDFMNALQRLIEGRPTNKALKTLLTKKDKLPINAVNVALEAGHSRTLISMKGCRYPKVREAIRLTKEGKTSEPTTYTQLIQNLRADLADEKARTKLLQTQIGEHFTARVAAEEHSRRVEAVASQLRRELAELHKIVNMAAEERPQLPRLILIRGLPGSGKSTSAKQYEQQGYTHFEADMYFEAENGQYMFDEVKSSQAHAWCLQQTRAALDSGSHVVVSNVFARLDDITPYTQLGVSFDIIEAAFPGSPTYPIPDAALHAMRSVWMPTDQVIKRLGLKSKPLRPNVTPISGRSKK